MINILRQVVNGNPYNVIFAQDDAQQHDETVSKFKKTKKQKEVSEKLKSIHSCQTQIQVIDIIHSPEMILKYIKALPTALY